MREELHPTAADYNDNATRLIESCLRAPKSTPERWISTLVCASNCWLTNDIKRSPRGFESDFAAFVTPGVEMAFADRVSVRLNGRTLDDEVAQRDVWVCGPAAFVALKALAFAGRGYPKDAYDLFYVLRNYGSGSRDVASRFGLVGSNEKAIEALGILERDFLDHEGLGSVRAASFVAGIPDEALRADVAAFVREFLHAVRKG
ncbi:nucleotidyl transferase AbiEii/AbiGii toxin family protein [Candidatus Palauibacter sp.]|uniref:nucleotidyl transferase AbiEii/AbiGii toxin family protein n=1 Tax=Candidatus Palauibacter sp. TaxID=3101350 RepID=UPI003AF2C735